MSKPKVGTHNEATRVAWIEKTLAKVPAGARLLDAGAGERQFERFCGHLNYVAQDFAQYDGGGDGAGLQTGTWDQSRLDIVSDITAIPEPDASFDAILCTEVFEHIPEPALAVREFSRLLKPDGHLITTAPFNSLTHFAPFHFSTGLSRYFYEKLWPENGFEILEISGNGNYFEGVAQEVRRIRDVSQKYAGVRPRIWEKWAIKSVLRFLERASQNDSGSQELLVFGFHVHAIKRGQS